MQEAIARMGEVVFSGPEQPVLRALGLGSCVGLCLFDPSIKLGCLAHIMLPESKSPDTPDFGKYANTAVPYVVKEMTSRGALKSRLRVVVTGGAQLFSFDSSQDRLDVGKRNVEAVKRLLAEHQLKPTAEDVGGNTGRTVTFDSATGNVVVKQVGGVEKRLA